MGGQIEVTEASSLSVWGSGGIIDSNGRQEEGWVGVKNDTFGVQHMNLKK